MAHWGGAVAPPPPQKNSLLGDVVIRKLIYFEVGAIINLYGVSDDRGDRCKLSVRQLSL